MLTLDRLAIRQGGFDLKADLRIETGDLVAIIGPSGAGKSTLLNAVAGFVPAASGRVLWNGADIGALPPGARPMSIVFQDNNLFPHLTAFQNVALALHPGLKLTPEQREKAEQALVRVGLGDLASRKPGALSGGQQSRVALARILAAGKPLILLDEPFAALGPALKDEMLDLVAELARAQAATLLMVTHRPEDALRIADKTVLVIDGEVTAPAPTGPLFDAPSPALARYLGQPKE